MKMLLIVLFLVSACSTAKLSSALPYRDEDVLSATISNEYLSSDEIRNPSKLRFGKRINSTSTTEKSVQSYTSPFPDQYLTPSTESPIHSQYYHEQYVPNQNYLPPLEAKNNFNVIPQNEAKVDKQQYLLPLVSGNQETQAYSQEKAQSQSVQYITPSQYNHPSSAPPPYFSERYDSPDNQYVQQDNKPQFMEHLPFDQQPHSYYNQYSQQQQQNELPSYEKQHPNQYQASASSNNVNNQYGGSLNQIEDKYASKSFQEQYFNPIDLHELSQTAQSDETKRMPKEHIPSSNENIHNYDANLSPLDNRRYDASSPLPIMQYDYNQHSTMATPSTYTPMYNTKQQEQNFTNSNYNQYQNNNMYQTTPVPVVEIGHSNNLPKWLNYSPSFMSRQDSYESTRIPPFQQAESRQSTAYGDKIIQQQQQLQQQQQQQQQQQPQQINSFAASRSSNVPSISNQQPLNTQAPEKYVEPTEKPRYVPQFPSQFKPAQPLVRNDFISTQYQQQQQQQPYANNFQHQQQSTNFQQSTPYIPRSTTEPMPILKQTAEMDIDGNYIYETLTGDQTHIMQQGHIENKGTDHEEQVMQGSYSFIGDDGRTYTVTYIADANGFRAVGDHLPTAPPIPEVIQRSIEINLAEEAAQAAQTAQAPQTQQRFVPYPQPENNNRYAVVEQANERSSTFPVPNYNANNNNNINNGYQY